MNAAATPVNTYEHLAQNLKTLSGADQPRYRTHIPTGGLAWGESTAISVSQHKELTEEEMFHLMDAVSLGKGITSIPIQNAIDEVSRSQRLFHFIDKARQSEQITPQTAKYAWNTWGLLREALSKTLSVPDASYGPDGQFLFIWDKGEHHLELEIEPSGAAYFFYRNRISGALWESDYMVGNTVPSETIEKLRVVA